MSKLKELFPTDSEADLDHILKCSFNLEHAIETLINRSVGEYQYVWSFLFPYIAKGDGQYRGFQSNHENIIVKEDLGSDILLLVWSYM